MKLSQQLIDQFQRDGYLPVGPVITTDELAEARTGGEIRVGLGRADGFDAAIDAHLAFERRPVKAECGAGLARRSEDFGLSRLV